MAVCEIESADSMGPDRPKVGGLLDLRMGTVDRQFRCQTCEGNSVGL